MTTWRWLVDVRMPLDALPRRPIRVCEPEALTAAIAQAPKESAPRQLANWLVKTAPPELAASLLSAAACPSVDSYRATELLDAGAELPLVVTSGRRWSKPDWHSDRRLTLGAAQYAPARDLAMLAFDDEVLSAFLLRSPETTDLQTLLSVTMNERCQPENQDIRVTLLSRVVQSSARQKTLLVTLPWVRRGDAQHLRRSDPNAADELDRLLAEVALMRAPIGSDALLEERIGELDMDWSLVRNPKAIEHALDYLAKTLPDATARDTATALLAGWNGTLRQLTEAAPLV